YKNLTGNPRNSTSYLPKQFQELVKSEFYFSIPLSGTFTRPPNPGLFQVSGSSRPHVNAGGARVGNYGALSKGLPISSSSSSFVNTIEEEKEEY
ncbi:hypothetical protein U1Q18_043444, partial [Sarracenia purpurea var. burkii]